MSNKSTNPVGYLQEFCQRYRTAKFPDYIELPAVGPDHCKEFSCKCIFDGFEVSGKGMTKKLAKTDAAKNMLILLDEIKYFVKFGISETDSCMSTRIHPGFVCKCSLDGSTTFGEGRNKKTAKIESASKVCSNLGILYYGDGLENKIKEENTILYGDKNAVSALQEACDQNKDLPKPTYENMPQYMSTFVAVGNVVTLSAEGSNTTKEGAKPLVARKMQDKVINDLNQIGNETELVMSDKRINVFEDDSLYYKPQRSQLHTSTIPKEFPDGDEKDVKPSVDDLEELKAMESFSLEDSVVEFKPLKVTEQQKLKIISTENGAIGSDTDSMETPSRCNWKKAENTP